MLEEILQKIGTALDQRSIPYMIIGGQAVLLYGEPRLTRDIDITLGVGIENLPLILEIAEELNLKILPNNVDEFVKRTMVLPLLENNMGIRVDFIFSYTPYERQAIERGRKVKIREVFVNFASAEDVIIHKVFAGRDRDIEDVRSILLKNPSLDIAYIKEWLSEFEKSFSEEKFVEVFEKIVKDTGYQQK